MSGFLDYPVLRSVDKTIFVDGNLQYSFHCLKKYLGYKHFTTKNYWMTHFLKYLQRIFQVTSRFLQVRWARSSATLRSACPPPAWLWRSRRWAWCSWQPSLSLCTSCWGTGCCGSATTVGSSRATVCRSSSARTVAAACPPGPTAGSK